MNSFHFQLNIIRRGSKICQFFVLFFIFFLLLYTFSCSQEKSSDEIIISEGRIIDEQIFGEFTYLHYVVPLMILISSRYIKKKNQSFNQKQGMRTGSEKRMNYAVRGTILPVMVSPILQSWKAPGVIPLLFPAMSFLWVTNSV